MKKLLITLLFLAGTAQAQFNFLVQPETDPIFSASTAATITLTDKNNWNTAYSWGAPYITSTSAIQASLNAIIASTAPLKDYADWNAAFGWGNHALAGYASQTALNAVALSTGPLVNYPNWNTAYGWGNHALAGYGVKTGTQTFSGTNTFSNPANVFYGDGTNLTGVLHSYTETDPVFLGAPAAGILAGDITNWNTAYGWGDHSLAGYASQVALNAVALSTGPLVNYPTWNLVASSAAYWNSAVFVEADPVFAGSDAFGVTASSITNWNTAFGWGNHSLAGYASQAALNAVILSTAPLADYANWNTAYSWGDHAAAGYASLSSTQAFTGYTSFKTVTLTDLTTMTAVSGTPVVVSNASAPYSWCVSTGTLNGWVLMNQTLHCQ